MVVRESNVEIGVLPAWLRDASGLNQSFQPWQSVPLDARLQACMVASRSEVRLDY